MSDNLDPDFAFMIQISVHRVSPFGRSTTRCRSGVTKIGSFALAGRKSSISTIKHPVTLVLVGASLKDVVPHVHTVVKWNTRLVKYIDEVSRHPERPYIVQ